MPEGAPVAASGDTAEEGGKALAWLWWALGIGALAILAFGAWLLRSRMTGGARVAPTIEKPVLSSEARGTTAPADADAAPQLRVEAQAISLGRSFANATLNYAITVSNLGGKPLRNVRIEADMTTAHSSLPVDQQLAGHATTLPDLAQIESLAAGAAKQARGEFRLAVNELRLIRQGKAHLYVPLLRLRIIADGMEPVLKTFVIGQKQIGRGDRLTPFRIDEMAQTYREIALRPLG